MRNLCKLSMRLAVIITISCGLLYAEEPGRGGDAGAFLRMGLGARYMGMGGQAVALMTDGLSLYHNPAGLVFINGRWGGATLRTMSLDRKLTFLGYGQSIGSDISKKGALQGGFALGWIASGVSNIDGRDFSGQHTDMLWAGEHAFCFGFALQPDPHLAIGVTGKLVYSRLGGVQDDDGALTAKGFGFDLGIMVRPTDWFTIGATIKDLRTAYTWDTQEIYKMGTQSVAQFPRRIEVGSACKIDRWKVLATAGIEKIEYRPWRFHAGCEWQVIDILSLRSGLRDGLPAFGLGFILRRGDNVIMLDYALATSDIAPSPDHLISWSIRF